MVRVSFILALGLIALLVAGCTQGPGPQYGAGAGSGRAVFTIADKAADMGAVTGVKVTVDSVMAQSRANGWVTVTSVPKTYDLLQLKASGQQALLADTELQNGTYEQVRLMISKVIVSDQSGDHAAKLPSGDLKLAGVFDVSGNTTTAITIAFLADQSLHVTGKGEYILAPVIHLQAKENASVDAADENNVNINGGKTRTDVEVGMDINGNFGTGPMFPPDAAVSIENGVLVITPPGNPGKNDSNKTIPAAGSANYQRCVSQCQHGNAGNGIFCTDGCRAEEAAGTKNTYWCDQLDNKPNIPPCYGTVAKTTGNVAVCDKFTGTDKDHCVGAFGSTSSG